MQKSTVNYSTIEFCCEIVGVSSSTVNLIRYTVNVSRNTVNAGVITVFHREIEVKTWLGKIIPELPVECGLFRPRQG